MVPLRKTLIEMGWPQKPSPVQTDNTTAEGVVNGTVVANKLKFMDLRFHWLLCHEDWNQFRFYWDKGPNNWAKYSTKHHSPVFHESKCTQFSGAAKTIIQPISKTLIGMIVFHLRTKRKIHLHFALNIYGAIH